MASWTLQMILSTCDHLRWRNFARCLPQDSADLSKIKRSNVDIKTPTSFFGYVAPYAHSSLPRRFSLTKLSIVLLRLALLPCTHQQGHICALARRPADDEHRWLRNNESFTECSRIEDSLVWILTKKYGRTRRRILVGNLLERSSAPLKVRSST